MSDIAPIGRPSATAYSRPTRPTAQQATGHAPRTSDSVELSRPAQLLGKLAELPEVRQQKIDSVRELIAQGKYDTPEKIDALLDNPELREDIELFS